MSENLPTIEKDPTTEMAKVVLFKFLNLHDRMMEERVELAKQSAKLEETIKSFSTRVKHFETLDAQLRQTWHDSIFTAAKQVGSTLGEEATKSATKNVGEAISKLQRGIDDTSRWMETASQEATFSFWKFLGAAIITGFMVGIATVYVVMPQPTLPFTDGQLAIYKIGETVSNALPNMTKAEKDQLIKLTSKK